LFKTAKKSSKPTVFFCGRLDGAKGTNRLVSIASRINADVIVAGDGPDFIDAKRLAARIAPNVKFLGRLKHDIELPKEMAKAWVFVSPLQSGFTLIEALSCGVPLAAIDCEWSRELMSMSSVGLLSKDEDSLVNDVNWLLATPAECKVLGARGRQLVEKAFSKEAYELNESSMYNRALYDPDSDFRGWQHD
jgi:rhamnosyl/mannosyltransferase